MTLDVADRPLHNTKTCGRKRIHMRDELKLSLTQDAEDFFHKTAKYATLSLSRDWKYAALNRAATSGKPLAAAHGKLSK